MSKPYSSLLCLSILSCLSATSAHAVQLSDYQGQINADRLDENSVLINLEGSEQTLLAPESVSTQLNGITNFDAIGLSSDHWPVSNSPIHWSLSGLSDLSLTGMEIREISETPLALSDVSLQVTNHSKEDMSVSTALGAFADSVHIHNINLNAQGSVATALELYLNSNQTTSELSGQVLLSAQGQSATALYVDGEGSLTIQSDELIRLLGDITIQGNATTTLRLKQSDQSWLGNGEGQLNVSLQNGARWQISGTSEIESLHWGKDGIFSINTRDIPGQNLTTAINTGTLHIDNGAVLEVSSAQANNHLITMNGIDNDKPVKLNVCVKDWSESAGTVTVLFTGRGANNVTFAETPRQKETLLTQSLLYPIFGTADANLNIQTPGVDSVSISITGIREETLGLSALAKNLRDVTDAHALALEAQAYNMLRLAQMRAMDSSDEHSGLWVDVRTTESRLSRNDRSDKLQLSSAQLTLGIDRDSIVLSQPSQFGLMASFADHDDQAEGLQSDTQSYQLSAYASTLTDQGNRFLFSTHYALHRGDDQFQTTLSDQTSLSLPYRAQSYGADIYWGAPHRYFNDALLLEPYAQAGVYHIRVKASQSPRLSLQEHNRTLSLAGLGTRAAWNIPDSAWTVNADLAWMHRFGSKAQLLASAENENTQTLQTDRLQESWAVVDFGVRHTSKHSVFAMNLGCTQAHDMKEKFHVGGHYLYRF